MKFSKIKNFYFWIFLENFHIWPNCNVFRIKWYKNPEKYFKRCFGILLEIFSNSGKISRVFLAKFRKFRDGFQNNVWSMFLNFHIICFWIPCSLVKYENFPKMFKNKNFQFLKISFLFPSVIFKSNFQIWYFIYENSPLYSPSLLCVLLSGLKIFFIGWTIFEISVSNGHNFFFKNFSKNFPNYLVGGEGGGIFSFSYQVQVSL